VAHTKGSSRIRRPILFTHGSADIMTPPDQAPSGYGTRKVVEAVPQYARIHESSGVGHTDLLEVPEQAVQVVGALFQEMIR
jgi:3-oxoadipate enol-lactonase